MSVNLNSLKDFLEGPVGSILGTRSATNIPEFARIIGTQVIDNSLVRVLVAKETAGTSLKNIEDNRSIAAVFASVHNFECYQLKGSGVYSNALETDMMISATYMQSFDQATQKIGIKAGAIFNWFHDSIVAVEFEVNEVFDQTPKVGAGKAIKP